MEEQSKKRRNWVSIALRGVFFLLFLCLVLIALLNVPSVQTFLADKVIARVTKNIEADVSINSTSLDLNSGIQMREVQVISRDQDTLAMIESLGISPKGTILSLLSGDLDLNDIVLSGVKVNLTRSIDSEEFNWSKIFPQKTSTASDSSLTDVDQQGFQLPFDVNQLHMQDVELHVNDERGGLFIDGRMESFDLAAQQIDADKNSLFIERITLNEPDIIIRRHSRGNDNQGSSIHEESDREGLKLFVEKLSVLNGNMQYISNSEKPIVISKADLLLSDIAYENIKKWESRVEDISFRYKEEQLKYLGIKKLIRDGSTIEMDDFTLRLNNSYVELDGQIENIIGDFGFENSGLAIKLEPSFLRLHEFYGLIPDLATELGVDPIAESRIQISGDFHITKSELEAIDVALWINEDHHFHGNISSEISDHAGRSIINTEVFEMRSNLEKLDLLSTKLNLPDELKRLGNVNFTGSYDGYVNDFVANGQLVSDLGNIDMDVKIDLSGQGDEAIHYDGKVELDQFNMAGFMNNQDFGLINAQVDITNGVGPNLQDSKANIKATIEELNFKNYQYRDATYEGHLSSRVINGAFNIEDANVDFEFEGIVDVSGEVPLFDFKIVAEHIDFCKLNLANFPCQVSFASDVSFRGNSLNTMEGRGLIGDMELHQDTSSLFIKNIELRSARIQRGMQLELKSDFVDFDIAGEFNLVSLAQQSFDQFLSNVEEHNETWKLKNLTDVDTKQDYSFAMYVKDASPLFQFLNQDIESKGRAVINGSLNTESELMELKAYIPYGRYEEIIADSLHISVKSSSAESFVSLAFEELSRGNLSILKGQLDGDILGDSLLWALKGFGTQNDLVSIAGISQAAEEGYFTSIGDHEIVVDSTNWFFLENKGFGIYPKRIDVDSFTLTDNSRSVSLNDQFDKHLEVALHAFQLGFINPIIDYDKLDFSGAVDAQFVISNLFSNRSITGTVNVDDFLINGDDFGELKLEAIRADNGNLNVDLSIVKDTQRLLVNGLVGIDSSFVDAKVKLEDYPMSFFEYIIDDGISETVGTTDITAELFGKFNDLNLNGRGLIKNGGTRVDYLGAFYRMEDQVVKIDKRFIDLNDVVLIDEMGNEAIIKGGLRHNLLADIRADLSISSPRFIGLNTTSDDNPLYYGLGVGKLDITFDGPFDEIDIDVVATADDLSQLFIPITSTQYGIDESFIKFDYKPLEEDTTQTSPLLEILRSRGADFEMNLTFTQDAEVSVIYDESTSNVLKGRGEGDLRINVSREGDFTIHGEYNVVSGHYLYTAYGVIAKPFTIQPGGTVRWTGDPINANLNVTATYPSLRVPLSTFLAEYRGLPGVEDAELNQRRDVALTLLLGGNLYEPTINFDIDFPNLTGQVRTLANSKLRTLETSENAINNQVVGLMVFGNFLPDDNPLAQLSAGSIGQTAGSTVSQFITSQLSLMLSDYLSSQLSQDGFITGIDLEIALAQNSGILNPNGVDGGGGFLEPDEVQVNLRNRIREGNLYFNVGGNYVRSQFGRADNYLTGDFSLEWFLTDDKRLKLRFYSNFGYDEARTSGRQRYGLGINFRKEFGSITNFDAILEDLVDDVKKESKSRY